MRLLLTTDDGTVIDHIEEIEEYDLSKPLAQSVLSERVRDMLSLAERIAADGYNH